MNTHTSPSEREPNGDARIHLLPIGARVVDSPTNATAWLIANARRGAMLYTAPSTNGETLAVIGAPSSWSDPDDDGVSAVNDADVSFIVNTRPSLGQTERDYDGA